LRVQGLEDESEYFVKPCTGFENDEPIITKVEGRYQYSEETTITDMSVSEFVDVSKSCGLSTADSDGVFRVDCSLALANAKTT